MKGIRIIISGGGTGGHVFPAIAIADAIKAKAADADILFVGARGKIEMERVPKAGYPIKGLWISGFHRKLTVRNLLFPIKLLSSLWNARRIVKQFKPDVAVGVGGYASGPLLEMASRAGVPCLIQEQNSYAGVTNKLLANKARKVCVAHEGMEKYFPASKIVVTGNPVRSVFTRPLPSRETALDHFGFEAAKKTIFILGGSLGARTLNQAMAANTNLLRQNENLQVLWQAGKLYLEEYSQTDTAGLKNVKIKAFIDRMDLAYAAADVVICRAGALTIAELCMIGKATVLVPSPNVAEDHQTKNAMALVEQQAGVLVEDSRAKENMLQEAVKIIEDENRQKELSEKIKLLGKPNAAEDIATEVLNLSSDHTT